MDPLQRTGTAKAILPGRQGGGWPITLVVGVVGAFPGGWIGSLIFGGGLGNFFDLRTWLLSILGAIIVLLIYGALAGRLWHPAMLLPGFWACACKFPDAHGGCSSKQVGLGGRTTIRYTGRKRSPKEFDAMSFAVAA